MIPTVRQGRVLLLAGLLLAGAGCNAQPDEATGARSDGSNRRAADAASRIVRLTADELRNRPVTVEPVRRGDFFEHRDFPGTVTPNEHVQADITTLVRGRVVDVFVDMGQDVKADTVLAVLNSNELGMAQSAYLKAQAKLYVAERAYQRAKLLLEEKVIGVAEAQRREGDMISARADFREAHDRLLLYGMSGREIARLAKEHTIRSQVAIEAPFDGRIIERNLTRGEVVETTSKLFVIADLSYVWVLANIPEKDIAFIPRPGEDEGRVAVTVNAYPDQVFKGRITHAADVLNPQTRTMHLRIEVANPERKLKPQMFATIRVSSPPEPGVLLIPDGAVQRERDRRFVFVQRDAETFEARDVELGESNGQFVKVLSGLSDGDAVVTKGAFVLKSELVGDSV